MLPARDYGTPARKVGASAYPASIARPLPEEVQIRATLEAKAKMLVAFHRITRIVPDAELILVSTPSRLLQEATDHLIAWLERRPFVERAPEALRKAHELRSLFRLLRAYPQSVARRAEMIR